MTSHALASWSAIALLAGFGACTATSSNNNDGDDESQSSAGGGSSTGSGGNSSAGGSGGASGGANTGGNANTAGATSGSSGTGSGGDAGMAGQAGAGPDAGGGSGGTDSGGAGGSGGSTTDGSQPVTSDSCEGSDVEPNEDRESATPYQLDSEFDACLQSLEDVDFYAFSVPDDDRGGVVTVSITDVGPAGDTRVTLWAVADNGEFHETSTNTEGASLFFNFDAKAGSAFRLEITNYLTVDAPNPYRLSVTYAEVPDEHEPNQTRPTAAPIEVGEAVEGYLFAGFEYSTGITEEDWYDWYEVALDPGPTSLFVDVVASDIDHEIALYDPLGTQIAIEGTNTEGSSVLLEHEVLEAGTYFVRVNPYIAPAGRENTADPPEYAGTPYTLTVTQ